jgi:hypothetical protein
VKRFASASLSILLGLPILAEGAEPAKPMAAAVLAELERMAELPLWPGFDPKRIPLAIYDGERTVLVRHPSPPDGFKQEGGLWVYAGQHPEMRANTSTDLGGVSTATLLLDPQRGRDARQWASVLVHETFHVFQRQRHPSWSGNEAELFTYPLDHAGRLAARRLESDAFRHALAAKDLKDVVCWSGKALELRRQRYASLPAGSVAYERGTELNEGLAAFIENLALGDADGPDLPADEYPAAEVRSRAYAIGAAQAALLDRLDPGWRKALEEGQGASLDELLAKALSGKPGSTCAFSSEESSAAEARAREDVARLSQEKQRLREAFLGRPGWKIEFVSAQPLWPQGFDPLNVTSLGKGEILHRRWVKLGNERGTVEVLDRESLSEGAGEHPLFNGLRKLTIPGLPEEPGLRREGDWLVIASGGVTARLKGAMAEREGSVLRVRLP